MTPADPAPQPDGDDDARPVLHVRRPRCDRCASPRLLAYRSYKDPDDDSSTRYVRCDRCGRKLILIVS